MRPEIAAYMVQATTELVKERGFIPADENDAGCYPTRRRKMKKLAINALITLLIAAGCIVAAWATFDSMAATQGAREQARLDKVKAGESTRIGGYQFMKISEVKR